ncbi:MAG: lamin tail domain-containing protein, partial [Chloroflexi bacterium]
MSKQTVLTALIILMIFLSGCENDPAPVDVEVEPRPSPTKVVEDEEDDQPASALPSEVLFSEVLIGVSGNNQLEFIELYNTESDVFNLDGWSLWYRLKDDQDEQLIIAWEAGDVIPGYGHYLLVREGQDVGVIPDAVFDVNLSERKGGLAFRSPWGD